jgi:hypothetical protein
LLRLLRAALGTRRTSSPLQRKLSASGGQADQLSRAISRPKLTPHSGHVVRQQHMCDLR